MSRDTLSTVAMENIKVDRRKKSDKARETYERNGGFSEKHIRIAAAQAEKRASKLQDKPKSNKN